MPFHTFGEEELRSHCRRALETLEAWLRTLIDYELKELYGSNYIESQRYDGSYILNKELRKGFTARQARNPGRYSRLIDAAELDDEIAIVCNPELFQACFKKPLSLAYPEGVSTTRMFLERLISPRNKLAHANPISIREAEQVICYCNDVVDGLKAYFKEKNLEQDYNAPAIIKLSDSLGNVFHSNEINRNSTGRGIVYPNSVLRSGESLSIEVQIDTSFSENDYNIHWVIEGYENGEISGFKVKIDLNNRQVKPDFSIYCLVTSVKNWHRLGNVDDQVGLIYKVLPPVGG